MDWRRFRFEYSIQLESLPSDLIEIEAYRQAALNLVLPPPWREQLDQLNRVRAVHGTTALEGNSLSEAEVRQQMEHLEESSEPPVNQSMEQRQVRNAGLAQAWARERLAPGSAPLQLSDILYLHKRLTEGSDEKDNVPGRLRMHRVVVGTEELGGVHRGAPPEDLPGLMDEFVEFVNSKRCRDQHPVVRALLAHFFLVTIHPFGDGNGRVSRLVEAGILFQGGYNVLGFYGLSNFFYRNADEYKRLLQQSRRAQPFDLTAFVAFGIKGFAAELRGINDFIKAKLNRLVYRDTMVRALEQRAGKRRRVLNGREYQLLDYLLKETEPSDPFSDEPSRKIGLTELLQAPYVRVVYKDVTPRTLRRELVRLAEMGFIRVWDAAELEDSMIEIDYAAIGKY